MRDAFCHKNVKFLKKVFLFGKNFSFVNEAKSQGRMHSVPCALPRIDGTMIIYFRQIFSCKYIKELLIIEVIVNFNSI